MEFYKGLAHTGTCKGLFRKSIISGLPPCSKITQDTFYPSSAVKFGTTSQSQAQETVMAGFITGLTCPVRKV